jgi:hypothetical protein
MSYDPVLQTKEQMPAYCGAGYCMKKLTEVQEAKELMTEAMGWSVFKWLFEKRSVRETADRANDVLDRLDRAVKVRWSDETKAAYKALSAKRAGKPRGQEKDQQGTESTDAEVLLLVEKVKEADDAAWRARMDAEATFDEAEKQMSTDLAREGCKKAIHSWELHEKAIRKAEAVMGASRDAE